MNSRSRSGVSSSMAVYRLAFSMKASTLATEARSSSSLASILGMASSSAFCSAL